MPTARLLLIVALGLAGCNGPAKNENPVLGPPPQRVSMNASADPLNEHQYVTDTTDPTVRGAEPAIVQTAATDADLAASDALFGAQVVATVNGAPIFASDVLSRYGPYLQEVRKRAPDQFEQVRDQIIRANLKHHIERVLLAEMMRNMLKPEQLKMVNEQLDRAFESEIIRLKRELKVNTTPELELELQKRDTNLEELKQAFVNREMAGQYIQMKAERPEDLNRQDLVDYYQAHLNEYRIPAQVRWQQIQVSFKDQRSKQAALEKLDRAIKELQSGAEFGDVARRYSDGPQASSGGEWDWTQEGSLRDKELNALLFSMPVGQISQVHESSTAFHIVKLNERRREGFRPFEDVQDEIRQKLQKERETTPQKLIDQLLSEAVIETEYDYLAAPRP